MGFIFIAWSFYGEKDDPVEVHDLLLCTVGERGEYGIQKTKSPYLRER